jgi:hypothetical protein
MISIGQAVQPVVDHVHRVIAWREAIAALDPGKPPPGMPAARWRNFLADCGMFFADDPGWGELALECGWSDFQLLGANRRKPYARIDQCGLLWLVNRARIEDLGESHCVLVSVTGARSTYRVRAAPPDEVCLPWEFLNDG